MVRVLSTDSVDRLRNAVLNDPHLVNLEFDELRERFNLNMVELSSGVAVRGQLLLPQGQTQDLNSDFENCLNIKDTIQNLSPSVATDERLWVTLCFDTFSNYCQTRWPLARAQNIESHCQLHWFARSTRNRIRDNAVSRLWWVGYICSDIEGVSESSAIQILLKNSDFRSSLIERNSVANSRNVLGAILLVSSELECSGLEFQRSSFRRFMQQVDLLGRSVALHALSISELKVILRPLYEKSYIKR